MGDELAGQRRLRWRWSHDVLEIIEAVILSLTTLGTAWSAYQAALWDGDQSEHYTVASAVRGDANRLSDEANAQVAVDLSEYETWLGATTSGNETLAGLIAAQMRPELQESLEAWVAAGGLERRPDLPASPLNTDEYQDTSRSGVAEKLDEAETIFTGGEEAGRHSDKYVAVTVVFALALFVVGIGSKFRTPGARLGLAAFGTLALIAGVLQMLALPIADLAI